MTGTDLVKAKLGFGISRFGVGYHGEFSSENNAFENDSLRDSEFNPYGMSCQASSIVWCHLALKGKYDEDPHGPEHIEKVRTVNRGLASHWIWQEDLFYSQLKEYLPKMKLQGRILGEGSPDNCIEMMNEKLGVYIIASTSYHIVAAATHGKQEIYYYDNDIGCCCCSSKDRWKDWAKYCERRCGRYGSVDDVPSWNCMAVSKMN